MEATNAKGVLLPFTDPLWRPWSELNRAPRTGLGHSENHFHVCPLVLVGELGIHLQAKLLLVLGNRGDCRRHPKWYLQRSG